MKTFALCAVCGVLAFVAVQYQMTGQLLGFSSGEPAPAAPPPPPKLKFPDDLACLARGGAVPQAAAFQKRSEPHPTVVLRPNGSIHKWNERLQPGWLAESVEETEIAIILPPQQKSLLQVVTYANGAPPIKRYQYELEARLVEARTGKLLGRKKFTSTARPVRGQELWDRTELGDPIEWREISHWMHAVTGGKSDH